MSMMLTLRRLSDADLGALQADPDLVTSLLCNVDGLESIASDLDQTIMEAAIAAVGKDRWKLYVAEKDGENWIGSAVASSIITYMQAHKPPDVSRPEYLDLDKSWHILHTVIAGTSGAAEMPAGALLAGEDVGPDGGYGPARVLRQAQVAAFADVLAPLDAETLKARVDPDAMRRDGVTFASSDFDQELIGYEIEDHFPALKKFVNQTVKKKRHLLMFLN